MDKNNYFWRKFSHYLLISLSALVLFAGVQSGLVGDFTKRGPDQILAEEDDCLDVRHAGCPEVGGGGQVPEAPTPPPPVTVTPITPITPPSGGGGPSCVAVFQYNECISCNTSHAVSTDSCSGAFSTGPGQFDAACAHWCPAEAPPAPIVNIPAPVINVPAPIVNVAAPVVNAPAPQPAVCVSDGSCNAPFPACGQLTQGVDNCNRFCQRVGQACTPGACVPTSCTAPTAACGQTTTGTDNCGHSCTRSGGACPVAPPPPVAPPAGPITVNAPPITVTTNPVVSTPPISITNSNPTTVTVSVPQGQAATREVVREIQTFGNVGVATTVTRVAAVQELPKTGLPALAWAALAFVPAGFKIRRFSKVKEDAANKPHYLWENRQFKV